MGRPETPGHRRPAVIVALPLAITIRNVLRTDTLERLLELLPDHDVHLLVPEPDEIATEFRHERIFVHTLEKLTPSTLDRIIGRLRMILMRRGSSTAKMRTTPRTVLGRLLLRALDAALVIVPLSPAHGALARLELVADRRRPYRDLFDALQPSVVLVTRVFGWSWDHWAVLEASRRRLPVVGLVSSWDNLSSKPFPRAGFTSLVVWNDVMRDEAMRIFDFPRSAIYTSGVPRFDLYFRRSGFRDRSEVFRSLGLDPARRLITYTTGGQGLVSPGVDGSGEPQLVEAIASAVARRIGVDVQLLVRLHPQAALADYYEVARRPGAVVHEPGRDRHFIDRDFTLNDERLLGETLLYSNAVINLASTITIEAAIFDTPIVCVGFHADGTESGDKSVRNFYAYEHYRQLAKTNGFRMAISLDHLVDLVAHYLDAPGADREARAALVAQQCKYRDGLAARRVAEYVARIAVRSPHVLARAP